MKGLDSKRTHFAVRLLATSASANESVELRLQCPAYKRMQALVRGFISAEKVREMQLRRKGNGLIKCGPAFDEGNGGDMRWRIC